MSLANAKNATKRASKAKIPIATKSDPKASLKSTASVGVNELGRTIAVETHPLPPFLPPGARLLMLGSFPPPENRWAMDFYYPNFQNDMWRILGLVFFGDKDRFVSGSQSTAEEEGKSKTKTAGVAKTFDRPALENFLRDKGIAVSDTAVKVRRLRGNASDQFLEIVEKVDLGALLARIPDCRAIMTAGEKATEALLSMTGSALPPVGGFVEFEWPPVPGAAPVTPEINPETAATVEVANQTNPTNPVARKIRHYRMPSSSRAYPKPLSEKAEVYAGMFREIGLVV